MMCKFKNGDKVVYQKGSNFECYGTFKAYEFADICWVNFTSGPDNGRCKWTHEDNLQHRTDSDISIKLKVEIDNKDLDVMVLTRVEYNRLLEVEKKYEQVKQLFN